MAHSENAKLTKGSHHLSSGCRKINDIHVLWIFTSLVSQVYYTSHGGDLEKVFQFWFI
jgi:hypothetical protein